MSPIREEKKASFGLNLQTGAWKDHGTDESGDLINLVEHVHNWETAQAINFVKEVSLTSSFTGSNGSSTPKSPKDAQLTRDTNFWTSKNRDALKKAQEKLTAATDHPLLETINSYDGIKLDTLVHFGVGIIHKWKRDWLLFPYDSGAQLYRREAGDKQIRSLKGSRPGASFFGKTKVRGKGEDLMIAKSPREAMLLHQLYPDRADTVGLVTGEQGTLSASQKDWIKQIVSTHSYKCVIVVIDCDTKGAHRIAQKLCKSVSNVLASTPVALVNISKATGGKFKDVTDCRQAGMSGDLLWEIISNSSPVQRELDRSEETLPTEAYAEDRLDLASAPPISETVYTNLPGLLKEICLLIDEQHRRDVFLVSSLPAVASQMPNVLAEHRDCYYSTDLFTQIIAEPGSGKGEASNGRGLARMTDQEIRTQARREIDNYSHLPDEEKANIERPKKRSLFIPANASARKMLDRLEANGGNGFIFETEIDTLLNATEQDWGNYTDTVRKAFQHEPLSIIRTDEEYYIDNPRLSICLTGTFDQFKRMFRSAENGHFSRYALYTFDTPRRWESHRPSTESRKVRASITEASRKLNEMYNRLKNRSKPLYINVQSHQWDRLDSIFSKKMELIEALGLSRHLHASNNRTGVIALRLISILVVLQVFEDDPDQLKLEQSLTPSDADVTVALTLAETFIEHAIRLYHILPKSEPASDPRGRRFTEFYRSLPEEFTTGEAVQIGAECELAVPERTVKEWLPKDDDKFIKVAHGKYKKGDP
ncbi:DUF3987 domain-containing protein [Fodinibius sediminis]|uniref:DUF3987 domain-containing protein n=1 Tax=Fodinibius sediminis TaxID=1214077 RepID=UPI00163DB4D7|nr:DUF3987 domain-containing protein [Fodinibius sediminis]